MKVFDRFSPMPTMSEGETGGGAPSHEAEHTEQTSTDQTAQAEKTFTQAEVDGILKERLRRAQEKWNKDAAEEKRLGQLSAEEKTQEELKTAKKTIEALEAEKAAILLKQDATNIMARQGLPTDLVDSLIGKDAEATKRNIEVFAKAFSSAVDVKVTERLKTPAPKTSDATSDAFVTAARRGARLK
ncbi:MAG: DUF4355 domain-containing protein [Christensenellaceae bacterium]